MIDAINRLFPDPVCTTVGDLFVADTLAVLFGVLIVGTLRVAVGWVADARGSR